MEEIFQTGDFRFRLVCPDTVVMPENFRKFQIRIRDGEDQNTESNDLLPEYTYRIEETEKLSLLEGRIVAKRPDLIVFHNGDLESRLIGVKGREDPYACYQEVADDQAVITLARSIIREMNIDTMFTSLFALERHLIRRDNLVLHCAYVEYQGEAILFSAPSETGKTTQANLWQKYKGSRTVNGDRALLGKRDGRWTAQGWPVCGTSEICENESIPVRAVVMLSQDRKNHVEKLSPGHAFPLLYSQITVNKWNQKDHIHAMDIMEAILKEVPVFHLGCTISREAVECLEKALCEC